MTGSYKEDNYRFNGPGKSTRRTTLRLRVLNGGPRGVLTAKGPATFDGGVKIREETEVELSDAHATLDLLEQQDALVNAVRMRAEERRGEKESGKSHRSIIAALRIG